MKEYYASLRKTKDYPDGYLVRWDETNKKTPIIFLRFKSTNYSQEVLKFKFTKIIQKRPELTDGDINRIIELEGNEKGQAEHIYLMIYRNRLNKSYVIAATSNGRGPRISQLGPYIFRISNEEVSAKIRPLVTIDTLDQIYAIDEISIIKMKFDLRSPFPERLITIDESLFGPYKTMFNRIKKRGIPEREDPNERVKASRQSLKVEISTDKEVWDKNNISNLIHFLEEEEIPIGILDFKVNLYGSKQKEVNLLKMKETIKETIDTDELEIVDEHYFELISKAFVKLELLRKEKEK